MNKLEKNVVFNRYKVSVQFAYHRILITFVSLSPFSRSSPQGASDAFMCLSAGVVPSVVAVVFKAFDFPGLVECMCPGSL